MQCPGDTDLENKSHIRISKMIDDTGCIIIQLCRAPQTKLAVRQRFVVYV